LYNLAEAEEVLALWGQTQPQTVMEVMVEAVYLTQFLVLLYFMRVEVAHLHSKTQNLLV
jgi:hypothetical protein